MKAWIFLLITGCTLWGCSPIPVHETALYIDYTDSIVGTPPTGSAGLGFDLEGDKWKEVRLKVVPIENVPFWEPWFCQISGEYLLSGNLLQRENRVEKFCQCVDSILAEAASIKGGRAHSSIYLPLAQELQYMSTSLAVTKRVIFRSDMLENSPAFSVYKKQDFQLLKENPDSVFQRLAALEPIPDDLSGIEVYIIYQPKNQEDTEKFHVMSKFYKILLEGRGASVYVGGYLTFQPVIK